MESSNTFRIINQKGIHARPSASLVKLANTFNSDIIIHHNGEDVDGKSLLGIMLLAAGPGSNVKVTAKGNDAEQAVKEIGKLISAGFGEI